MTDIIKEKPDKRKIYWFWSRKEDIGKLTLEKYLVVKHSALVIHGRPIDMKYAIAQINKKPKICVLDMSGLDNSAISYEDVEGIKKGLFFSSRHKIGMITMNVPHMIIFANNPPEYDYRWVVTEINEMNYEYTDMGVDNNVYGW